MSRRYRIGGLTFWLPLLGTVLAIVALGIVFLILVEGWLKPDAWDVADTLGLAALALFLAALWVYAPLHEYRLLDSIAGPIQPREPGQLLLLLLIPLVAVVALFPAAAIPTLFGGSLLILKTIESWNARRLKDEVRKGIELIRAARRLPNDVPGATSFEDWVAQAETHEVFYFGHPWDPLLTTEMLVLSLATVLSALVWTDANIDVRHVGSLVATLLIVAAVIGNEIVVARWRSQRDRALPIPMMGP
ncbi:MAG: hypothetical protein ACRDMH_13140 [Solirubrobacterales bacterium]